MDEKGKTALSEYRQIIQSGDAFQLESCTRCGICSGACLFYTETGNPEYTPIWKAELIKHAYEANFSVLGRLRNLLGLGFSWTEDSLKKWMPLVYYACTNCNRCAQACPMGISIGNLIHKTREGLAKAGVVPEDLLATTRLAVEEGSPLGVTDEVFEERMAWVQDDWEVNIPLDKESTENLVVFTSIEIQKFPSTVAAIAKILNASGIDWSLSRKGREITNFGIFLGDLTIVKILAQRIIDAARELNAKRIIISECGHAYDVMRWLAPNIFPEMSLEVLQITELMAQLFKEGRLKIKKGSYTDGKITYHDPCKVVRRGGMIEEPRILLSALAGNSFLEMRENREKNWCCGGGGGVISIKAAEPLRMKAFGVKVKQLEEINPQAVATSCSNCRLQFLDGVKHYNLPIKVLSLSELVASALEDEKGVN